MINHIKAAWLAYYWEMKNRVLHLAGGKFDSSGWPKAGQYWDEFPYPTKYRNFYTHMSIQPEDGSGKKWSPSWIPK